MRFFTLLTAIVLPALAMAQTTEGAEGAEEPTSTTTCTSTTTLTKTITLTNAESTGLSDVTTTATRPTGTVLPPAETTDSDEPESTSGAAALDAAQLAFAGVAGMLVVALM